MSQGRVDVIRPARAVSGGCGEVFRAFGLHRVRAEAKHRKREGARQHSGDGGVPRVARAVIGGAAMLTRRAFVKTGAGAAAGFFIQTPARREVSVGRRRIKVVDVHGHLSVPEVGDIIKGTKLAPAGARDRKSTRLNSSH